MNQSFFTMGGEGKYTVFGRNKEGRGENQFLSTECKGG